MRALIVYPALVFAAWLGLGWATDTRAQTGPLPAFDIVVRDGRFTPSRLEVPAGTRIKLNLQNDGPGPLEFENADMHVEKVLGAGARSFVVVPKLAPGEHSFIDEFNPITGELILIAR